MVGGKLMKYIKKVLILCCVALLLLSGCGDNKSEKENATNNKKNENGKPDTWIADRKIKGLVFMSEGDVSPHMNEEIAAEIKKKTGIELELQGISGDSSTEALASGLAAGDLPDFIAYYLNNSGRPEMKMLNKASEQGMFHDLTDMLKDTKVYSKYFEEGYLPTDTKENIMFQEDQDGTYLVHMSIPREAGKENRKYIGGPYIQKDIVDELGIDPASIDSSEKVHELAKKIKEHGFKDVNGKEVTPIGPTAWGGSDRHPFYNDLVWTGSTGEKFFEDKEGKIKFETQTDYPMKRVKHVQKLIDEGLMHPEFYTMEENRAVEGLVNKSFGIVSDLHNFKAENSDMKYVPLGPINNVQGEYKMVLPYKSGYAGWSIPSTTENPEEIVKFADFLASKEGKLLSWYGIEGRDYELNNEGNPVPTKEVLEEIEKNPDEAAKRGFRGAGSYWAEHLGYTDIDREADFGEAEYGDNAKKEDDSTPQKIIEMWGYDEKMKDAEIVDGLSPKSFIPEFEKGEELELALTAYDESLIKAYYAKSEDEAQKIIDDAKKKLKNAGLEEYIKLLEQKKSDGTTIRY